MRSTLLVLVGLVAVGCSSPVDPKLVEGTWHQDFSGIPPGNSFQMTLSSNGSGISGTGFGCGEAGPCATSTIVGNVDSRGIHLTITSVTSVPTPSQVSESRFDGHPVLNDLLVGSLRVVGPGGQIGSPFEVRYSRGGDNVTLAQQNRTP
jgi:hypothetical protein